jgi:hypothetical protein
MFKTRLTPSLFLVIALMIVTCASSLFAQEYWEEGHDHDVFTDPTVAPLVVPTVEDFTSDMEATDSSDKSLIANSGVSSYFEVTGKQKAGLLTPYYRYSKALAFKARIPLIWNRTLDYGTVETSSSGIGDITLESEYSRIMRSLAGLLRFQLSLKLPTGNDEPDLENGFAKPALGTGTLDVIGRAVFSRATPEYGYVASLLYRQNTASESISTFGTVTDTYKTTNASQIVASAFYRHLVSPKLWVHIGASMLMLGDGESEYTTEDSAAGTSNTTTTSLNQGGTLIDLYPGISYQMGPINPFIGVRIPLSTSYDNDLAGTDRDTAFIVQFTYQPDKLGG